MNLYTDEDTKTNNTDKLYVLYYINLFVYKYMHMSVLYF